MSINIDIDGLEAQSCEADTGEYVLHFYSKDYDSREVRDAIPNPYTVSQKEYMEGGELNIWYLDKKE